MTSTSTGDIALVDETKQGGRKTHFVVDVEPTTPSPLSQQPSIAAPAGASLAGAGAQSRATGIQWLDTEGSAQSQSAEYPGTPTHYPPGLEAVDASAAPLPPKKSKSRFYNPFQRRSSPKSRVTSFAFRTSGVKGFANKEFERTSDKEDPARKTSWFGKLLGATAGIRSVLSLSTEAEKAAEDHQAAIEAIEALDKNRDGRVSKDELVGLFQQFVTAQQTKRALRRALGCAVLMTILLVVAITVISVMVSFGTTTSWVTSTPNGNYFSRYDFGKNTEEMVGSADVVDIWEVEATASAYDSLQRVGAFKERPKLAVVFFQDGQFLEFAPETLQVFETTARLAHSIGIVLTFASGKIPEVVYRGGPLGLSVQNPHGAPTGPTQALYYATLPPPMVTKVQLLKADEVNVNLLPVASDAVTNLSAVHWPVEETEDFKAFVAEATRNLKGSLMPLLEQEPETAASPKGKVVRMVNSYSVGVSTTIAPMEVTLAAVKDVCQSFETGDRFSGTCGRPSLLRPPSKLTLPRPSCRPPPRLLRLRLRRRPAMLP